MAREEVRQTLLQALRGAKPKWQQDDKGLRGDQPSDRTPISLRGDVSGTGGRYVVTSPPQTPPNQT